MSSLRRNHVLAAVAVAWLAAPATLAERAAPDVWLLRAGEAETAIDAERRFNPASLVKLATTLWALERLGPEHRFETVVGARGRIDGGTLHGDLVVAGGADPDLHLENAWLIADALNRAGVRRVTGDLVVDHRVWIGWEGGSERRLVDPTRRATAMAARLRDALEPGRVDRASHEALAAFLERTGRAVAVGSVGVRVDGNARAVDRAVPARSLVRHRSNPLVTTLKRFNAYSNNDIERLAAVLGGPEALTRFVRNLPGVGRGVRFATLSGLGSNRLSARDVLALLDALRATLAGHGLQPSDVLPVAGCNPGTLEQFAALGELSAAGSSVTAKTGTLVSTDGGVAALAGYVGEGIAFCAATTGTGRGVSAARRAQDRWVAARLARLAGPDAPTPCERIAAVRYSDDEASVTVVGPE